MKEPLFELLLKEKHAQEFHAILSCNEKTQQFGLSLTEDDVKELIVCQNHSLRKYGRVELGKSILEKIIFTFSDSTYISQSNYKAALEALQDIFYEFKNEAQDALTDDELLEFMNEQYNGVCDGDLDYLEGTCLPAFAQSIREGYTGYQSSGGRGEYSRLDPVPRWDADMYQEILKELFW